ncbi:3-hydroxyacyl-CoA dehydrogenase NAD-binding domain-containing protein [Paraburkholderia sp. GAS32]|uniref:3-hydroxyacyl-CoA dehydrogenase NAD-binding domain-containing protein n=1 Tax=Paraburkholderia sp. GAS32 TaxID=3035129 RepID=UPI003D1EBD02
MVDLTIEDGIAIITADNPPVNALGHTLREGLMMALGVVTASPAAKAIVLSCKGRTFFAGADITEFGKPPREPSLETVITAFEASQKPVVAGIFGTALGGGLELALGCHFRVAVAGARMGLPEVKLGILPGGGGTQRLPRLIGPEKAIGMIVSGKPLSANEAYADGVIDEIVAGPVEGAVAFAKKVLRERRALVRVRDIEEKIVATRVQPAAFEQAAKEATRRLKGVDAPAACVVSVRNAFTLPFDEGIKEEHALFMKLVAGVQSRAQMHIFFSEREATKVPGIGPDVKPAKIFCAAVIGAGTMGGGIAMNFANAGISVSLIETDEDALTKGVERIKGIYDASVQRGSLPVGATEKRMALITGSTDWAVISDADVVIEAVFEEMNLKKDIFARIDTLAKPGALLASNTSTLDVDAIAHATNRPGDVVGMHFFSPANVMKLLEIVRGKESSPQAIATAIAVGKTISKIPVVVGNCYGFVGNRMLHKRTIECERLMLEGALPHEIDAVVTKFGFPMGPFAMGDLAGLDVDWRIRKGRGLSAPVSDALAERGRFGQKVGRGYYLYESGSRIPVPDPETETLIKETAVKLGIVRRKITEQEILERMIYPMINEAARILEEGIATRHSDIDVIWVYGYGWPVWRGGPCFYADLVGIKIISERLDHYAELIKDESLKPAKLLRELADRNEGFISFAERAKAVA